MVFQIAPVAIGVVAAARRCASRRRIETHYHIIEGAEVWRSKLKKSGITPCGLEASPDRRSTE
jgi:hypothetical protein